MTLCDKANITLKQILCNFLLPLCQILCISSFKSSTLLVRDL